jgi:hypothetical protein
MTALPSPTVNDSWFGRAREVACDLLIATALIWTLPLLLGVVVFLGQLLLGSE